MIVLQTIAVAFAMFSAVPVPQFGWNEKNMRYALCAFPLVGLLCGVLWCVCGVLPLPAPARAAGFCLVPVLADGFISGVAALCAVRLCPAAAKAVFASHCSAEPAARIVLEALGKAPIITAGLHLGEGTGAVASIPLWDMALAVYGGCYSFAEGGIAPYTPQC